jgi:hypothetical protein
MRKERATQKNRAEIQSRKQASTGDPLRTPHARPGPTVLADEHPLGPKVTGDLGTGHHREGHR